MEEMKPQEPQVPQVKRPINELSEGAEGKEGGEGKGKRVKIGFEYNNFTITPELDSGLYDKLKRFGDDSLQNLVINCELIKDSCLLYSTYDGDRIIVVIKFKIQTDAETVPNVEYSIPFYQSTGTNSSISGYWFPFTCLSELDKRYMDKYPDRDTASDAKTGCYIPFKKARIQGRIQSRFSTGLLHKFSTGGFNIIYNTRTQVIEPGRGKEVYFHNVIYKYHLNEMYEDEPHILIGESEAGSKEDITKYPQFGKLSIFNRFSNLLFLLVNKHMFKVSDETDNPYLRVFTRISELSTANLSIAHIESAVTIDKYYKQNYKDINDTTATDINTHLALHIKLPCNSRKEHKLWNCLKDINFMVSELLIQMYILKSVRLIASGSFNSRNDLPNLYLTMTFLKSFLRNYALLLETNDDLNYTDNPECDPMTLLGKRLQ